MPEQRVPKIEFEDWLENPITQDFFSFLAEEEADHRYILANGLDIFDLDFVQIGQAYSKSLLYAQFYNQLVDVFSTVDSGYEELYPQEEIEDEEDTEEGTD